MVRFQVAPASGGRITSMRHVFLELLASVSSILDPEDSKSLLGLRFLSVPIRSFGVPLRGCGDSAPADDSKEVNP